MIMYSKQNKYTATNVCIHHKFKQVTKKCKQNHRIDDQCLKTVTLSVTDVAGFLSSVTEFFGVSDGVHYLKFCEYFHNIFLTYYEHFCSS